MQVDSGLRNVARFLFPTTRINHLTVIIKIFPHNARLYQLVYICL